MPPARSCSGSGRPGPRHGQRRDRHVFKVPAIVATLGTLSIFRGIDYLVAGSHQVPLARLPPDLALARATVFGIPIFVVSPS